MTCSRRFLAGLALVAVMGGFVAVSAAPQAQPKPEQALKAAMDKELDGDLKTAIEMYRKLASSADRAVAAKALLRLAECYEKLGDAQAQDVYKRLVRDFADQPSAAEARARLAALGAPSSTIVWQTDTVQYFPTSVSADGRYLSLMELSTGNVLVRDLTMGTNRLIVAGNLKGAGGNTIGWAAISRDGTQIAYGWHEENVGRDELWLAPLRGEAKPRRVYSDPGVAETAPYDWSPDGKRIAIWQILRNKGGAELAVVSVDTGQARVLKHTQFSSSRIFFSPDGRYIAYDLARDASGAHDVWVTALDGTTDSAVVENRGNDVVMGWSPDGQHLLVASEHMSTTDLTSVAIHNGRVRGTQALVKTNMEGALSVGATTAGELFYWSARGPSAEGSIQVADFDLRSGSVTSPRDVSTHAQEDNVNPSWSPDGKYLAYLSDRPADTQVIVIRTAKGELVREIQAKIRRQTLGDWQPDSQALLAFGQDSTGRFGAFRVDVETGEASLLLSTNAGLPFMAADGRTLYYRRQINGEGAVFVAHDIASGAETEVLRRPSLGIPNLSPNGRFLATDTVDPAKNERLLLLVPLDGGVPREVMRVPASVPSQARVVVASWLPDSQSLIARLTRQPGADSELWQVPVAGDSPRKLASVLDANVFKFTISPDGRHVAYRVKETAAPFVQVWKYANFLRPGSAIKR